MQIIEHGTMEGNLYLLARTTTPWTLPSNMFLAVGENITYITLFDKEKQEYYTIAQDLIASYYKSRDEYIQVSKNTGQQLQ